ncbi:hypothetical protein DH2020_029467 [Rehmannia glutinosa]|uniref:RBR-type E3 ubiquitin transferase n=1 Tax=Rehmannia glutinosa TaxID=99300 RepID=A0ABR0VS38_REHGL
MEDDYYMSGGSEEEDDCLSSDRESESLDGLENEESDAQWGPSRAPSSKVITKESLLAAQREDLRRVMDLLSVKEHHARTLLIHYRWDVEKLISVYVEKGNLACFLKQVLPWLNLLISIHQNLHLRILFWNIEIGINNYSRFLVFHCWTQHFVVKINEGQSKRIRCMAHKCNAICDEDIIRKLVSVRHPDLAEKFDRFLLESYIEDNKMVKWCPSIPHCGNAIRVEDDEFCEVECSCGLQFCFSCLSEAHSPCSCSMWVLWTKKCRDESETVNWITVHTKPCPKCHKPVEKNGGCNLLVVVVELQAEPILGPILIITAVVAIKKTRRRRLRVRKRDLYRYMHYHNRYKAHIDSSKQESRLRETIKEKVSNLEARDSKLRDFSWVTNGLYRLQQLESNVEKLSKFLEEPFDEYPEEQVMQIRMKVINLCVITDSLCKKMYECIENELLGSLQYTIHIIAPYQSKGIEKAEELTVGWGAHSNSTNKCQMAADRSTGDLLETGQASSSGTSDDCPQSSRKRPRKGSSAGSVFDLNLPAEPHPTTS